MTEVQTQIAERMKYLVKTERKLTREILDLINRAQVEKVYLELGHASLFAWLTEGLGYSNPAAQRRIDAARMLRAVPEHAQRLKVAN